MDDGKPEATALAIDLIAGDAIEIIQECRKLLGLQKGELLTDAVRRIAMLPSLIERAEGYTHPTGLDDTYVTIPAEYWYPVSYIGAWFSDREQRDWLSTNSPECRTSETADAD